MDARGMLKAGIGLSVAGLVVGLVAGLTDNGASGGPGPLLRAGSNVATLFGLLFLVLAIYALGAPPAMPGNVVAGALLFTLGRLGSVVLNLAVRNFDPTIGLMFTTLGLVSGLGTILLFYGVYQVVRDRLGERPGPRPPPSAAPAAPPARAAGAGPAPRRSSFRPPQAPLPPGKPGPRPPPR